MVLCAVFAVQRDMVLTTEEVPLRGGVDHDDSERRNGGTGNTWNDVNSVVANSTGPVGNHFQNSNSATAAHLRNKVNLSRVPMSSGKFWIFFLIFQTLKSPANYNSKFWKVLENENPG